MSLRVAAALLALLSVAGGLRAEVPIAEFAEDRGLTLSWDPFLEVGELSNGFDALTFYPRSGALVLNHSRLVSREAVSYRDGTVLLSEDAVSYIGTLFVPEHGGGGARVAAIVLDPGHGGRDPGASHSHIIDGEEVRFVEKHIVLAVARDLEKMLSARYPDREIIITRDTDVFLELEERVEIANAVEVDPLDEIMIFVSIHANASLNSKTYGYEVWYLPPEYERTGLVSSEEIGEGSETVLPVLNLIRDEEYTSESIRLAGAILSGFDGTVGEESRNLGLKEEVWFVVRNAKMPSVLVELGYLTNSYEAEMMSDPAYLRKLTLGLYNGIAAYVESFERRFRSVGTAE